MKSKLNSIKPLPRQNKKEKNVFIKSAIRGKKVLSTPFEKFMDFLNNKAVVSLALGVIIADTVKQIVNVLVEGLIRPLLGLFVPSVNEFSPLNIKVNNVVFKFGDLISVVLQSFIIFFILYLTVKWILRNEELLGLEKKEAKKEKSDEKESKTDKKAGKESTKEQKTDKGKK